ncbi:hypothetical protein [Paludibacter sp. 221]|uniref:hypothetical protein n=1 Tax=Paludibacter sp. 221 TaxID=2302939 RepID=UPI0013D6BA3C|nr:hypothetical protein [Paludibacter sp. 221]
MLRRSIGLVTACSNGHYSCRRYETLAASSVPTARRGWVKSSHYQTPVPMGL